MSAFGRTNWFDMWRRVGQQQRLGQGLGLNLKLFSGGKDYYGSQAPSSDGARQAEERANRERAVKRLYEQQKENEKRRYEEEQDRRRHERTKELAGMRGEQQIANIEKRAEVKPPKVEKPETPQSQRARDQLIKERREAELRHYQATGFGTDEDMEQKVAIDPSNVKRRADAADERTSYQRKKDEATARIAKAQAEARAAAAAVREEREANRYAGTAPVQKKADEERAKRDAKAAAERAQARRDKAKTEAREIFKLKDPYGTKSATMTEQEILREINAIADMIESRGGGNMDGRPEPMGAPGLGGSMAPEGGMGGEMPPSLPGVGPISAPPPVNIMGLPQAAPEQLAQVAPDQPTAPAPAPTETDEVIQALASKPAVEIAAAIADMRADPDRFRAKGVDVDRVLAAFSEAA